LNGPGFANSTGKCWRRSPANPESIAMGLAGRRNIGKGGDEMIEGP
jgi:hypothetical protein